MGSFGAPNWLADDVAGLLDFHEAELESFRIVLRQLCEALKEASERADEAEEIENDGLRDSLVELECSLAEDLLGAIFVIGQRFITVVVSAVKGIVKDALSAQPTLVLSVPVEKKDLLTFGHIGASPSPIEVVEAFANYFKHSSEWAPCRWEDGPPAPREKDPLSSQQRKAAMILAAAGATSGSTGVLRAGAKHLLGSADFWLMEQILEPLQAWRGSLGRSLENELRAAKLI